MTHHTTKAEPAPELWCELCDAPATANDWNPTALMLVCPTCLERMAEDETTDPARCEMGLVGTGGCRP